jgi:hypothetical protein
MFTLALLKIPVEVVYVRFGIYDVRVSPWRRTVEAVLGEKKRLGDREALLEGERVSYAGNI